MLNEMYMEILIFLEISWKSKGGVAEIGITIVFKTFNLVGRAGLIVSQMTEITVYYFENKPNMPKFPVLHYLQFFQRAFVRKK